MVYLNSIFLIAYKHLPFLVHYSCQSCLDSCTNFRLHCSSFVSAQRWAPRYAIRFPTSSGDDSSDTSGRRRRVNGRGMWRNTVTVCLTICSFCAWHRSCPIGSSIWHHRWLGCRCIHSHLVPSAALLRLRLWPSRRARRCRRWAVRVRHSPGPQWACWLFVLVHRFCPAC